MKALSENPRYAWALEKRCLLLLVAVLVLMVATPILTFVDHGRSLLGLLNVLVFATGISAVARSTVSISAAVALGAAALFFQTLAIQSQTEAHFALSWSVAAAFYAYTIAHLLHYVLHRDTMTADKLYGAVAAYLMIGLMWAFVYGVAQYFDPESYAYHGAPKRLDIAELVFFSFAVLTTAGFGDITPVAIQARFLTIFEAVTGVMYVAILIARLTGVYPHEPRR
ncbi:MAG TPA: ion channel [Burkholderiales bacterium]|nr:ion channel [Burkholderiales bacterium]